MHRSKQAASVLSPGVAGVACMSAMHVTLINITCSTCLISRPAVAACTTCYSSVK
jgi:hypothetical protein